MTDHTVNREDKTAATESPCLAQAPTTANPRYSISSAIARHIRFEKASFHTPGHKGRQESLFQESCEVQGESHSLSSARDLTELPGLDDLSAPIGVIADLEDRAARLWGSGGHAFVSVNGATAALTAAILATADRGEYALIPRNAHRSVINALCLARLKPIWYEPKFEGDWGFWGSSTVPSIQLAIAQALQENASIACALVVSPTYAGALSDVAAIARLTKSHSIPLIVDEAHGAHFLPDYKNGTNNSTIDIPASAIACGADAVAHSWHKTLPALTQTGALHLPKGSLISPEAVRSSLNLVTSSSPSYMLLASMEKTLSLMESPKGKTLIQNLLDLSEQFRQGLAAMGAQYALDIYGADYDTGGGVNPSHILVSTGQEEAHHLYEFLQDRGIFAEAAMGSGVLFMLGLGSQAKDVELALSTIKDFLSTCELNAKRDNFVNPLLPPTEAHPSIRSYRFLPPAFEPVLPPHQAMFLPNETIPVCQALGRIAAQCLSPCPPGIPILIPGQKITEEVLELISDKTIVVVAQ